MQVIDNEAGSNQVTDVTTLNCYGDRFIPTTGSHGADIASQRSDWLDEASSLFARKRISDGLTCNAVDIGTGSGTHAAVLARLGATVLAVDLDDKTERFRQLNQGLSRKAVTFYQGDVMGMPDKFWPTPIHLFYSQRSISYPPYDSALALFRKATSLCEGGARFFVSSSGLDTEYGETYPHRNLPVAQRYAFLADPMARKHGITEPQCLYNKDELSDLLTTAGLRVIRAEHSTFGNPKVTAVCP